MPQPPLDILIQGHLTTLRLSREHARFAAQCLEEAGPDLQPYYTERCAEIAKQFRDIAAVLERAAQPQADLPLSPPSEIHTQTLYTPR